MHKFLSFLIISFLLLPVVISAQSVTCSNDERAREPVACAEIDKLVKEASEAQKEVDRLKGLGAGFASDIAFLTAKINTAQANIRSKNNQIALLTKNIAVKQTEIFVLDTRITKGKMAIADILRKTNNINSYSLVEAMLSDKNLSEFFVDIDTYASTEEALDTLFDELRTNKAQTETEKVALNKKKEAESAARATLEAAKKQVEIANAEKKTLLAINDANKKTYEQVVADRQAKAAKIKAVLFPLLDSKPIDFGTALAYAETAEKQTGVRAAFILGIFATESGKGKDGTFIRNVGKCLLTNTPEKGDGKNKDTGNPITQMMKGSRDVDPFFEIMKELGLDPYSQPVSCPSFINGVKYGYGGAMGPAQFIPSTWRGMQSGIARATGKTVPNPWEAADAFMAAALYLKDLGASTQDWTNERTAACRYNSGSTCYRTVYNSRTRRYETVAGPGLPYGNNVMWNAEIIQRDIDFLRGN